VVFCRFLDIRLPVASSNATLTFGATEALCDALLVAHLGQPNFLIVISAREFVNREDLGSEVMTFPRLILPFAIVELPPFLSLKNILRIRGIFFPTRVMPRSSGRHFTIMNHMYDLHFISHMAPSISSCNPINVLCYAPSEWNAPRPRLSPVEIADCGD
jgi:hypothetical protein